MKRLISKVLLALITLSVAAPASAFGSEAFKDLEKAIYGIAALGLIGAPVAGGLIALRLGKSSSGGSKVMAFLGGAVVGGSVGIYCINRLAGNFFGRELYN